MGPLCLSATLLGYLVCVIGISKSFHSFLFKLCIMIDVQSKKDDKDQESIQSSTTPDPGYQNGKVTKSQ